MYSSRIFYTILAEMRNHADHDRLIFCVNHQYLPEPSIYTEIVLKRFTL